MYDGLWRLCLILLFGLVPPMGYRLAVQKRLFRRDMGMGESDKEEVWWQRMRRLALFGGPCCALGYLLCLISFCRFTWIMLLGGAISLIGAGFCYEKALPLDNK